MTPDQLVEYLLVPGMPKEAGAVTTTEREAKHMTERVTIDVDPDVVRVLRAVAGESATGVAWVHQRTLTTLADAIDAALPMPEPAAGSIVQLPNRDAYGRIKLRFDDGDDDNERWQLVAGTGPSRLTWSCLRAAPFVVVFDGATLGVGR